MPRDAQLAIEVTADAGERLQKLYPQNTERVEDGQQIKFFLNVDPPLAPMGDPKNAGRVEIAHMGGPTNFRFGLNSYSGEGAASTRGNALTQREIVGFQIRPKPSPFVARPK